MKLNRKRGLWACLVVPWGSSALGCQNTRNPVQYSVGSIQQKHQGSIEWEQVSRSSKEQLGYHETAFGAFLSEVETREDVSAGKPSEDQQRSKALHGVAMQEHPLSVCGVVFIFF